MKFSLVICTYQRPESLLELLESVEKQTSYPDQILIIDGSLDLRTKHVLCENSYPNLEYFLVGSIDRGLTKQRNFGVSKVDSSIELICFLDDDTVLDHSYFEEIIKTYTLYPNALGVSGYINNEVPWKKVSDSYIPAKKEFSYDGWKRIEGVRFNVRRMFGLAPDVPPGYSPNFSHGYSAAFLPPSNSIYEVEMLMGGIASYRKEIFEETKFSSYFNGYGLYEDADFSLRVSKIGQLYINTKAGVVHNHDKGGRPNTFNYGKMVVRNGWYVWRIKTPNPNLKTQFKWHATSFLLTLLRFLNVFNSKNKLEVLNESLGRTIGWFSLIFDKPKLSD